MSNIIENHDQPRGVSHYLPDGEVNDTSKKMLATLHFMVRGIPFIYQGQEIGMENVDFTSMDQIDDVMTHDEYQVALRAGLSPEEALEAVKKMSRDNAQSAFFLGCIGICRIYDRKTMVDEQSRLYQNQSGISETG